MLLTCWSDILSRGSTTGDSFDARTGRRLAVLFSMGCVRAQVGRAREPGHQTYKTLARSCWMRRRGEELLTEGSSLS